MDLTFTPADGVTRWANAEDFDSSAYYEAWSSLGRSQNATISGSLKVNNCDVNGNYDAGYVGNSTDTDFRVDYLPE